MEDSRLRLREVRRLAWECEGELRGRTGLIF